MSRGVIVAIGVVVPIALITLIVVSVIVAIIIRRKRRDNTEQGTSLENYKRGKKKKRKFKEKGMEIEGKTSYQSFPSKEQSFRISE